jgi:hypothetical protein
VSAFTEAVFATIESDHAPTRVKMCERMCCACEAAGAIWLQRRAAGTPCAASGG